MAFGAVRALFIVVCCVTIGLPPLHILSCRPGFEVALQWIRQRGIGFSCASTSLPHWIPCVTPHLLRPLDPRSTLLKQHALWSHGVQFWHKNIYVENLA